MTKYLFLLISFASLAQAPFYGKMRYFHMSTDNSPQLPSYAANAISGEFGYKLKFKKYWTADVSGSMTSSFLNSSAVPTSRYEIGLFDQVEPSNQTFLTRFEQFNIQYVNNNLKARIGRQVINTPFINPQDGRMHPTAVGGLLASYKQWEVIYIYEMSPRGTMGWAPIESTIGYYPAGVNALGQKSGYVGKLNSSGILHTGYNQKLKNGISIKLSNLLVDQISTTAILQVEHQGNWGSGKVTWGVQAMKQHALGDNLYDEKGQHAASWGLKLGFEVKKWGSSINFNQISSEGRYLMPREWGKDPFYTFMPRERNEGYGGVNAIVVRGMYQLPKLNLKIQPSLGYFQLPAVNNFALNKYGMPSYLQSNIEINWDAQKIAKGLDVLFVYVNKMNQGITNDNPKYILNKVDMSTWNLIVNYPL